MKLLKKYPNRRIYDTSTSRFITIEDVRRMVLDYEAFQVIDTRTGDDLTRSTLLQVITDMEANGRDSPLTNKVLEELIRFYGDSSTRLISSYLEQVICTLLEQRNAITGTVKHAIHATAPIPVVGELTRQLTKFWQSALGPLGSDSGARPAKDDKPGSDT